MSGFGITKENMMAHELAAIFTEKGYVHVVVDATVIISSNGIGIEIEAVDSIYIIKIGKRSFRCKSLYNAINKITDTLDKQGSYYYA
ncbi:hypothetical protein ACO1DI_12390 [Priestia sp. 40]|uniref:hypothetical protein n=1 Tax=Priestia sp. 40 TaxID=3394459 RepID=UPI003BF6719C